MSYIETLRSLNESDLKKEIEDLILASSSLLINDKARTALISGDLEGSWDEVDDVEVNEISIDTEKQECRAQFNWESRGSGDEDDERILHGWGTACIIDDRSISFIETGAELDGSAPSRPKGGGAADAWWDSLDDDDKDGWTDNMNKE